MSLTDRILISPSVIATDLTNLGSEVKGFKPGVVDLLHLDVMDGNFVPNITFGPDYIRALKQHTEIPLDVHLMIERPGDSIKSYIDIKPWAVTIHHEATRFPARLLKMIRENKIIAGLAVNPATPVESIFDIMPYIDMVLIMSVDPGFYGQSFMEISISRIEKLSSFIRNCGLEDEILIQVDGGITRDNIKSVVEAGARVVVAGSSSFKGGDVNGNIRELKDRAMSVSI
jgi:ribulose-phosphate 3-epimerase